MSEFRGLKSNVLRSSLAHNSSKTSHGVFPMGKAFLGLLGIWALFFHVFTLLASFQCSFQMAFQVPEFNQVKYGLHRKRAEVISTKALV